MPRSGIFQIASDSNARSDDSVKDVLTSSVRSRTSSPYSVSGTSGRCCLNLLFSAGTISAQCHTKYKKDDRSLIPAERIEAAILLIRGQKVILDEDLARLYRVPTHRFNEQVSRNIARFPGDFMFRLSRSEFGVLTSQSAISRSWGGRRHTPRAFTEQGVAMLSSVLRSRRAVEVNIEIMRAFVRLRRILSTHADLARKLEDLDKKYDAQAHGSRFRARSAPGQCSPGCRGLEAPSS